MRAGERVSGRPGAPPVAARVAAGDPTADVEELSLDQSASHLLEECRTIVPGVQTVFGFQLISVFNERFAERLSQGEQLLHLAAMMLVVVAMGLVMAPAALHRMLEPHSVSRRFVETASRFMLWSLVPLALGICLDAYLVSSLILHAARWAAVVAVALLLVLAALWYALPRALRRRWPHVPS